MKTPAKPSKKETPANPDDILRRMLNTQPKPHKPPQQPANKAKS